MSTTRLEDLSNEILYEIFEFLDGCDIYQAFLDVNTRFEDLLKYSPLPLKFDLSFKSKSMFGYYCTHIVAPNVNRIVSLCLFNPLSTEYFLAKFAINSSLIRLESLTIGKMKSDHLISFVTCLSSLPRLFSLSIDISNEQKYRSIAYQLIIDLPVLKYCRISFEHDERLFSVLEAPAMKKKDKQCSTIEHLIIDGGCFFDHLTAILSYTPQLRRLSCHSLFISNNNQTEEPIMLANLTHLYLKLSNVLFERLEIFLSQVSCRIELLYISILHDITYLDAIRWERLISCHLVHLRVFDFQHKSGIRNNNDKSSAYQALIDQFTSSFWLERRWFFAHQHCIRIYGSFDVFYSTQPYRRHHYKLYEHVTNADEICLYQHAASYLCRHVTIENQWNATDCSIRFPRAKKVTLNGACAEDIPRFIVDLERIICLAQVIELVIDYEFIFIQKFLELLRHFPNIHSLTIPQTALIQTHSLSSEEIETVRYLSNKSRITKVTVNKQMCTVKQIRFLINVCPRLQYLKINVLIDNVQFLLSTMKENNHRLFLLCVPGLDAINTRNSSKWYSMIDHEKLHDNYSVDRFKDEVYVWG